MPRIHIMPDNVVVEASTEETVLDAALRANIPFAHACGGQARCSTCRFITDDAAQAMTDRNQEEAELGAELGFNNCMRLACQTSALHDLKITRPVLDEVDMELTNQLVKGNLSRYKVGEEQMVAVLFTDIVGYTPLAESLPPYDIIHILNRYFHKMGGIVDEYGGQVIDYYGDGLLAVFGVMGQEAAGSQCIAAGKAMFAALEQLNTYLQHMYRQQINIRVGAHYGKAIVGTIGHDTFQKFAVIGDTVNMGARLEAANKELGTRFLISDALLQEVKEEVTPGHAFDISLKGKTGTYLVHEVPIPYV